MRDPAASTLTRSARTTTRGLRGALTPRALAAALLAAGALAPTVAAADAPLGTPRVPAGAVTVPSMTVPSVGTPPVDVPSVGTPVVRTPPVHAPAVTTPAVSTPALGTPPTPAIDTPPVRAPAVPAPARALPGTRAGSDVATTTPAPVRRQAPAAAARPAPVRASLTRGPRSPRRPASARHPRRADTVRRTRDATAPVGLRDPSGALRHDADPQGAAPAADLAGPARRSVLPGAVGEIVDALPRWVLGVFLGFALIAMLMAINAYLSSRRARTLTAQRAALLDDVGLLQTALLAPVPAQAGDAQVSVAYRPAAGPAAGGDFYDVIALGSARTGLLLGDVSGHGREALGHAALVRYTVRTFLAAGHDPADALARADDCLASDLDGHFATVIAAVYDHDSHTLRYAKAGHHPPVVLGAAHDPDAEPVAPPLGAGLGIRPETSELTLESGSTVCLFTDGLIEARRDGALLGRATLVELLGQGRPDGPELLDRVVERADQVSDDLAVCVLRRA